MFFVLQLVRPSLSDGLSGGVGRPWFQAITCLEPPPDEDRARTVDMALDGPELTPCELAVRFTDTKGYFISESTVYLLLNAHDLITSPPFVVIKEADEFRDKTIAPNQL